MHRGHLMNCEYKVSAMLEGVAAHEGVGHIGTCELKISDMHSAIT